MLLRLSHSSSELLLLLLLLLSWPLEIVQYTAVSSAKSGANAVNFSGISLMLAEKRHSPNTDPRAPE